jgi:hypothetical protein
MRFKVIHGPAGTVYRDSEFRQYIMNDFGNAVPLEGKILEQAVDFMLSAFVFNSGDIGH